MTKKAAVGAGHGGSGSTPGKRSPNGEYEWDFNDVVVRAGIDVLEASGVEVLRTDDESGQTDVPLSERTNRANRWGADVYWSAHHNAFRGVWGNHTGVETYTQNGSHPQSERLASIVHPKMVQAMGLRDRGMKKANLHINRETEPPSILTEGGFMDSTIDIVKMRDDSYLKAQGVAIAEGILEYLGVSKGSTQTASSGSSSSGSAWTGQILRNGDRGELVKSLQEQLIDKGFNLPRYGADGVFGSETENALRSMQRATGIAVDGIAGPQSYRALRNYSGFAFRHWDGSIIREGHRGEHVREVQQRLLDLGYRLQRYGADGVFGSETRQAVAEFQQDAGIGVDGIPGPETYRALLAA